MSYVYIILACIWALFSLLSFFQGDTLEGMVALLLYLKFFDKHQEIEDQMMMESAIKNMMAGKGKVTTIDATGSKEDKDVQD